MGRNVHIQVDETLQDVMELVRRSLGELWAGSSFTPGSASVWRGPANNPPSIKSYTFSDFSNHS